MSVDHRHRARADGGLGGDRRAAIAAGCRFFAGYPMTPFTELLEHFAKLLPEVGGVCINAESELEAVGMAWGALATGARAATGSTGQGLVADAGVVLRDHARRAAARDLQHGARPGRLLPGHARRRPRRLPPHRARAHGHRARPSSSRSSRSTSPTSGATRCSSTATTCSRTRRRRSTVAPVDVPAAAAEGLGRRRHRSAAPAGRASVTPLGVGQARPARRSARRARRSTSRRRCRSWSARCASRPGYVDDAETVVVAFGTPGQVRALRVQQLRDEGREGRLRAPDHAVAVPVRRRARRGRGRAASSACSRSRRGQMIDDVRLGVLGAGAGRRHRRDLDRRLGLRRRPPARRRRDRERILALHAGRAQPVVPGYDEFAYELAAAPDGGHVMSTTPIPLGPVLDTSPRPQGARVVEPHCPTCCSRSEHHLCPGCGEPLALRGFLEAIQELGLGAAHDRRRRHRLLHELLRDDGRRPRAGAARPRAVGRHRREAHAARRDRLHAPGRRRHGERGPAGGAAHRGARRERHVHPAEQRRVRRDRRPHDRDDRASASARRTRSTAATPSTTATRSSSATCSRSSQGAAYVARGSVHNAGRGRAHEEDVQARVRDPAATARASRSSRCSRCARPAGSSRPPRAPTT